MDKLEKILMPMADVLTKNRVLIAIRDGFLISTPLLIVGSIFLLVLGMMIYYPFIKTLDKKYLAEEAAAANESSEEDDISFDDLDLDNL